MINKTSNTIPLASQPKQCIQHGNRTLSSFAAGRFLFEIFWSTKHLCIYQQNFITDASKC